MQSTGHTSTQEKSATHGAAITCVILLTYQFAKTKNRSAARTSRIAKRRSTSRIFHEAFSSTTYRPLHSSISLLLIIRGSKTALMHVELLYFEADRVTIDSAVNLKH